MQNDIVHLYSNMNPLRLFLNQFFQIKQKGFPLVELKMEPHVEF